LFLSYTYRFVSLWKRCTSLSDLCHPLKGIVGASSNVLGKNKAFWKLKYLLWELSERLFFQLYIVVRNLEKSKIDSFLENIITSTFKCINLIAGISLHWSIPSYPRIQKSHNADIIDQKKILYNCNQAYFINSS
jgi:hypothetical protein